MEATIETTTAEAAVRPRERKVEQLARAFSVPTLQTLVRWAERGARYAKEHGADEVAMASWQQAIADRRAALALRNEREG